MLELEPEHVVLGLSPKKPLVSLVVPAYNEATIIENTLNTLVGYMESLASEYDWELIVINDGSTDRSGQIAELFACQASKVTVLHHHVNFGLGQSLRYAFSRCRGDYIITLDSDLSYAPHHIRSLLEAIKKDKSKIVVASPYMPKGSISNVPWLRKILSIWANRFLSISARGSLSTLTGLVRVYDGRFLRSLHLKSTGMEINAEILYKAMILNARVQEIPAHLSWPVQRGSPRRSNMKVLPHTMSMLFSGFLFQPMICFLAPGFALIVFAVYVNTWMVIHCIAQYQGLLQYTWVLDRASAAVAAAYQQFPHTFIVGGLALMLGIQLVSLGILALQSKAYFEEVFYLGTSIYKARQETGNSEHE